MLTHTACRVQAAAQPQGTLLTTHRSQATFCSWQPNTQAQATARQPDGSDALHRSRTHVVIPTSRSDLCTCSCLLQSLPTAESEFKHLATAVDANLREAELCKHLPIYLICNAQPRCMHTSMQQLHTTMHALQACHKLPQSHASA